ncbi:hypothetical protein, partial [Sphingobacterium suaedae]
MQKSYYLLLLVALFSGGVARAQYKKIVFSTDVSLSKNMVQPGLITNGTNMIDNKNIQLTPRFAYRFHKRFSLGALYQYGRSDQKYTSQIDFSDQTIIFEAQTKTMTHHVGLFLQSAVYDSEKFALFLEADARKGGTKTEVVIANNATIQNPFANHKQFLSGLHLGGRYQFLKGLGIEARINQLVQYTHTNDKETSL